MQDLGYEYRGEAGIAGRHYFKMKGSKSRNVHMFARDNENMKRHLRFRDYLRAHADARREYEALKLGLAKEFVSNTHAYADAKTEFCKKIDARAKLENMRG